MLGFLRKFDLFFAILLFCSTALCFNIKITRSEYEITRLETPTLQDTQNFITFFMQSPDLKPKADLISVNRGSFFSKISNACNNQDDLYILSPIGALIFDLKTDEELVQYYDSSTGGDEHFIYRLHKSTQQFEKVFDSTFRVISGVRHNTNSECAQIKVLIHGGACDLYGYQSCETTLEFIDGQYQMNENSWPYHAKGLKKLQD